MSDKSDIVERLRLRCALELDEQYLCDAIECEAADEIERLRSEIARLREERRWISVEERLPDDLRRVMVMAPGLYGAQVAWLLKGKWHDGIGYPDDAIDCRVTHWMPLPPGPEGDG